MIQRLWPQRNRASLAAMLRSLSEIDWPSWVQAVGSVLAILVAVWVDRGSARRQRMDRQAEARDAVRRRAGAVLICAIATEFAADAIEIWEPTDGGWMAGPIVTRAIDGSHQALKYFLGQAAEVDASLIISLTHADSAMETVRQGMAGAVPLFPRQQAGMVEFLRAMASDIRGFVGGDAPIH